MIDRNRIPKLSGLKYLRALIEEPEFQKQGNTFWVMPTAAQRATQPALAAPEWRQCGQ